MMMKENDIETTIFAPCGMNYKVCYKHYHHKKPCDGRLKSNRGKPEYYRRCKTKDCTKAGDLSHCYACSDYPCKLIKNPKKGYKKRHQTGLIENSKIVKNQGLEVFMEQQKKKYIRSTCGGVTSIHDKKCSECQEKTFTIEKGQVQKLMGEI